MGTIQQYENGIKPHGKGIQITFIWNGERHRPTLRIEPTKNNLKYAGQLKGEIERAVALGTYTKEKYAEHFPTSKAARITQSKKESETFRDISKKWLKASSHLATGTLIKYSEALEFWLSKIGDDPIAEIKYSELAAFANSQEWKPANRNNRLIPLRGVFNMAYLDGLIDINPADRVKNSKGQKEPPDPLTSEEVDIVLEYMLKKYGPQVTNYFEYAFFSGMRPSELIALRWGDIDWERGLARVQRARTFGEEHDTKTYKVRDVEMNLRARQALLRQKEHTFLKDGYIFENPKTGKAYQEERPLRRGYWNPTLKALGMRTRNFYQTRHTYATLNLMAGANPMWVSKQLGHANMNMLMTVYGKWINGADKSSECGKLDALFLRNATRMPQEVQVPA